MDKLSAKVAIFTTLTTASSLIAAAQAPTQGVPDGILVPDGNGRLVVSSAALSPGPNSVTTKIIAERGDAIHQAVTRAAWNSPVAPAIEFVVTRIERPRSNATKASPESGTQSLPYEIPSDPNPPNGPGYPGLRDVNTNCGFIQQGAGGFPARIEYEYEYRFTRDTNNDAINDSDPRWVIVGVRVYELPLDTAQFCQ